MRLCEPKKDYWNIYISFQMLSLSGWNYAKVICVWELSDGCHYSLEKN